MAGRRKFAGLRTMSRGVVPANKLYKFKQAVSGAREGACTELCFLWLAENCSFTTSTPIFASAGLPAGGEHVWNTDIVSMARRLKHTYSYGLEQTADTYNRLIAAAGLRRRLHHEISRTDLDLLPTADALTAIARALPRSFGALVNFDLGYDYDAADHIEPDRHSVALYHSTWGCLFFDPNCGVYRILNPDVFAQEWERIYREVENTMPEMSSIPGNQESGIIYLSKR